MLSCMNIHAEAVDQESYLDITEYRTEHKTHVWPDGARYEGEWSGNQPHGYGSLTYANGAQYWGRFDHPWERRDDCRVNIDTAPIEHVKKLYFDTVVFNEPQLRHLIEVWGADHIVMGTDYPFDMAQPDPVGHVDSVQGLGEDDKARVMGINAAELLGIEVPVVG